MIAQWVSHGCRPRGWGGRIVEPPRPASFADITGGIKAIAGIASVFTGIPIGSDAPAGSSIGGPPQIGSLY